MIGSSVSEVTTLWRYTNLFIIIIIFLNLGRSSRGGRQKLILEIIALMVNHASGRRIIIIIIIIITESSVPELIRLQVT